MQEGLADFLSIVESLIGSLLPRSGVGKQEVNHVVGRLVEGIGRPLAESSKLVHMLLEQLQESRARHQQEAREL